VVIVEPTFFADICTPSSRKPEAEVTAPVSNGSAGAACVVNPMARPATLASNMLRTGVMSSLLGVLLLDFFVEGRYGRLVPSTPCCA
jgi:hypothetical protein